MTTAHNTPENVDGVARAFNAVMLGWYKAGGAYNADRTARVKVTRLTPELVLDANDHFDANMAMDAAFKACGIETFGDDGHMSQDVCDLWNAAWRRAAELVR